MTKNKKVILISVLLILVIVFAVGCQSFKWGPVGTNDADAEVINNGSLAVQQGKYLYYVNGMDDAKTIKKPEDNYFGKGSVKGSIMKSVINEDGTLSETAIVVPKMFYSANTASGIYIFGEWIYYVSPSTKTDNLGAMVESLEYMRTKTDGTQTQTIDEATGFNTQYVFTKDALLYLAKNELVRVSYNDKKVGKRESIDKDVVTALFTKNSNKVFYTKSNKTESYRANEVYFVDDKSASKVIINETTFVSSQDDIAANLKEQFTITLSVYDSNEDVLYYTKKSNGAAATTTTNGYKFDGKYDAVNKANEKTYALSALSSFRPMGSDVGLLITSADIDLYKPIAADAVKDDVQKYIDEKTKAERKVLFFKTISDVEYMYYIKGSSLYRMNYKAETPIEERISVKDDINTTWIMPSLVGDTLYYINSAESNYLYSYNLSQYKNEDNNYNPIEPVLASGFKKYEYPKDADYTMPNDEIPAFITEADLETYINAHKVAKK